MNKTIKSGQKKFDSWHKQFYQQDVEEVRRRSNGFNKKIIKLLEIDEMTEGELLDVACGKAVLLLDIRDLNKKLKIYGSDISSYAINVARKILPDVKFSVDDGENLSLKGNHFDYVTCLGGLEYYKDQARGAQEISRILKKNGKALILVPNLMFLGYIWLAFRSGLMPSHGGTASSGKKFYDYNSEKFYTYQGWKDVLVEGGLKIMDSYAYNYIGHTKFANSFIRYLYNYLFSKFVPFNLSYCFIFICKK